MNRSPHYSMRSLFPTQFGLKTVLGLTLVVCLGCSLFKLGSVYLASGLSLVYGSIVLHLYVGSPHQVHTRVVGTLLGAVLFLASLWLPLGAELEQRGWQMAIYAMELVIQSHRNYLTARIEMRICLFMICSANLAAVVLPPLVIAYPRRMSLFVTSTIALLTLAPWSLLLRADSVGVLERPLAYWVWCSALTLLLVARLVPFHWRIDDLLSGSPNGQTDGSTTAVE